jgi:hypothetical protein
MRNMYATISADVVSSTSLSKEAMIELNEKLKVRTAGGSLFLKLFCYK